MTLKRPVIIAAVIAAGLSALLAGIAVNFYSTTSAKVTIADLKAFEEHWKPLNAEAVSLDAFEGKRVLVNFWGSWCPPCVKEMPMLDAFNEMYSDQVRVIGVVVDREQPAKEFLAQNAIRFPSVIADIRLTSEMLELLGGSDGVLPYSVAFSDSGNTMFTKLGPLTEQDLSILVE